MNQPERRVDFDTLNLFGKALFVGGSAVRFMAGAIDTVIDRAVDIVLDAEKAFQQGLDSDVEDAKILHETTVRRSRTRSTGKTGTAGGEQNESPGRKEGV